MTLFGLLLFGFLLGLRHALDADHVAAVASLSTRGTSLAEGVRVGVFWGIGHSLMLFFVGSIVLLVDGVVPERLASVMELLVGIMLVGLGLDVWRRLLQKRIRFDVHRHDDGTTHLHAHAIAGTGEGAARAHEHLHRKRFPVRALIVGIVHGMAGSAAIVLLTLDRAPSVAAGLLYISIFGLGSVLGMALLSVVIAVPLRFSANGLTALNRGLQAAIGTATILIGLSLVNEMLRSF